MDAIQVQPHTVAAESYSDTFFQPSFTDLRFDQTKYHTFYPVNSINETSKHLSYYLPAWQSKTVWDLGGSLFAVKAKITNPDNTALDVGKVAGPINNVLYSLISDCTVYLGEVNITPNAQHVGYKKYLENLLTFDNGVKLSALEPCGWATDSAGSLNTLTFENAGLFQRACRFGELDKEGTLHWSTNAVWFVGTLPIDLRAQIINGIPIRIDMSLQSNEFFLMSDTKIKYVVEEAVILGLAKDLSMPVYEKIQRSLKSMPIKIPFRRKEIVPFNVPTGSTNYITGKLDNP